MSKEAVVDPSQVEVRLARPDEHRRVAVVLGEAFAEDPVIRWLLPSGRGETRLFEILARYQHGLDGGTDVAICEGQIIGASLWDRAGYRQSNRNSLLSLPGLIRVLGVNSRRGVILEQVIHAHRPAGTFWYLAAIGTVLKGRGVGSALLADRLRRVPEHAYLESSNIANVSLYERFGFRVTSELRVTADGPTLYPMLRDAA